MNTTALSGALRAQEMLVASMVRAMPDDLRRALVEGFRQQIGFAEDTSHASPADKELHDAMITHARKLLIRIESLG
ncbi:hypothetical protein Bsp3421_001166 [Burkholderia sp. FERM BP-3421]|jgi:hypothetical protein|uniref:hypothetical protein n=1 Tax=Burkholderia sp. FERM BP-3421 TaxID=1494466 RepID=UPI00235F01E3|nr:hypothetical protein [Burkholderia sp. FERM BP-3421]WDD91261.1 hypothetical protein Bsp3421_001166 [Burkholderia sp. FERM BP-3421]